MVMRLLEEPVPVGRRSAGVAGSTFQAEPPWSNIGESQGSSPLAASHLGGRDPRTIANVRSRSTRAISTWTTASGSQHS